MRGMRLKRNVAGSSKVVAAAAAAAAAATAMTPIRIERDELNIKIIITLIKYIESIENSVIES